MSNLTLGHLNIRRFYPAEDLKDCCFHSRYFYPNSCHFCSPGRKICEFGKLIRCDKCNMISYCGKLHKILHEEQHQNLCKVIQNLLESSGSTNLFGFLQEIISPYERLNRKYSLISVVEKKLKRKLYDDEKQMFLYPRVCYTCLESNPASLVNCKYCPQMSFCKKHENMLGGHKEHHHCSFYNFCFTMDWHFLLDNSYDIFVNTKNFPFLFLNPETFEKPPNMRTFLTYFSNEKQTAFVDTLNYRQWSSMCTQLYTNSLTLLHAIEDLEIKFNSKIIIHIIGIQNSRRKDFAIHEVLLHLIPNLKKLKVVAVGEELKQDDLKIKRKLRLCHKCFTKGKTLSAQSIKMPYVSYVESKYFKTPNFIITFNFGDESEVQMWDESLLKIMENVGAPFVMTTNTRLRTETQFKKITERFEYLNRYAFYDENVFPSSKPYRDDLENIFKFDNEYIAFYYLDELDSDERTLSRYGDSQDTLNSIENIEQFPESCSPDKEEKLKDTKEKAIPETLDSHSNPAEMSKEVLDDHVVDPPSQNQQRGKKKEDEATGATKAQTSKSAPNLQKRKSENKVQEKKDGNNKSKDVKNKKSKTDESSEHSVEKVELVGRLEETKRKIVELEQENDEVYMIIKTLTDEIRNLNRNSEPMVLDLLTEIRTLNVCMQDCKKKLSEARQTIMLNEFTE